jgi:hypothetical protein
VSLIAPVEASKKRGRMKGNPKDCIPSSEITLYKKIDPRF